MFNEPNQPKVCNFWLYQVDPTYKFSPAEFHGLWKIKSGKLQLGVSQKRVGPIQRSSDVRWFRPSPILRNHHMTFLYRSGSLDQNCLRWLTHPARRMIRTFIVSKELETSWNQIFPHYLHKAMGFLADAPKFAHRATKFRGWQGLLRFTKILPAMTPTKRWERERDK